MAVKQHVPMPDHHSSPAFEWKLRLVPINGQLELSEWSMLMQGPNRFLLQWKQHMHMRSAVLYGYGHLHDVWKRLDPELHLWPLVSVYKLELHLVHEQHMQLSLE